MGLPVSAWSDEDPIMASVGEISSPYIFALTVGLIYISRDLPVFAFARARRVRWSWLALVPELEIFILLACVGVPRRVILIFAGVLVGVAAGLSALILWRWGLGDLSWDWTTRIYLAPDVFLLVGWMGACQDARISRAWALLAAWPYVGFLGGWRIVRAVRGEMDAGSEVASVPMVP